MTETSKTLLNLGLTALVSAGTGLVVSELSNNGADRSAGVGGNNIDSEALKAQLKESLYNEWLNDPIIQNRLRGAVGPIGLTGPAGAGLPANYNVNGSLIDYTQTIGANPVVSRISFANGKQFFDQYSADGTIKDVYAYNGTSAVLLMRVMNDGTIQKIGGGSFAALSDERVKDNIEDFANGLAKVIAIQTKTFKYKKVAGTQTEFYPDFICQKIQYGVIAQQLKEVCPEMVTEGTDGFLSVDLSNLPLMLVNAVKELDKKDKAQQTTINQYKTRIETLEGLVQGFATRLEALEAPQA